MQRAHALIQRNAAKSTEFVSSMFPADMHRRLFDTSISELKIPDAVVKSPKPRMKARRNSSIGMTATRHEDGTYKSKPIAELYPDTTIMVRRYCLLYICLNLEFVSHIISCHSHRTCLAG